QCPTELKWNMKKGKLFGVYGSRCALVGMGGDSGRPLSWPQYSTDQSIDIFLTHYTDVMHGFADAAVDADREQIPDRIDRHAARLPKGRRESV
ncbi:MAG: hypothetical protein ABIV47_04280, partial [Roseiflexaceae bacterium]